MAGGPRLDDAWAALGGAPEAVARLRIDGDRDPDRAPLPGPLPVDALARATVGAALLAAAELAAARGAPPPVPRLDAEHVAAAFVSERHLRLDGAVPGVPFDPLSRFLPAADGWVRLHANYDHHRAALLRALAVAAPDDVPAAVAARPAREVEQAVVAAGGCAAAVRDRRTWDREPAAASLAAGGLLRREQRPAVDRPLPPLPAGAPPATGLRILDLTRVIAGPIATRWLAALGADVLRIDRRDRPELPLQLLDTGAGKRSALLDLRDGDDRATLERLLAGADAVVHGYRPGALAAFGLDPPALAERHPQLVVATLSAWGDEGPWGTRRGFDSLVQAATGIALVCSPDGGATPGALPAQALDHGTGYLLAAAVLRGLAERARGAGPLHARLALARTADWLLDAPRADPPAAAATVDPGCFRVDLASPFGVVSAIAPPGALDGRPLAWSRGPVPAGSDPPRW
ncbi:CoA transferase [Patulibacter defluvii]|uniref:CoA transferase n=1 Tax=Patulibacter defluvii TaxID=3095358 RepID=UPI002A755BE4|nr:CoA transferase [Patulibacter sp. DM4]